MTASAHRTPARQACCGVAEDARNHAQGVTLTLVVAGGPRQQVLRPRELEARALEEDLSREALFGTFRVLDRTAGTRHAIRENALVIEQEKACIDPRRSAGAVRLVLPAERPRARGDLASAFLSVAIREDIEELLQRALRFVAWVLDRIDPMRRISDVVPVVNLSGALGWRTRVKREWPDTRVLVLTNLTDDETRRSAFVNGADSFLTKRDIATRLLAAIKDTIQA